ncbi:MAG: polysaccharide deacetylase family protein [Gemmatimonadota bacterium]|nr:polysaccharide deacetylase family protein [Gemmatimonadota bacterium]
MRRWRARLGRLVRRRSPRGVVLCYHRVAGPRLDPAQLDVSPNDFAVHCDILRTSAQPLPLDAFEKARRAGALPPRAVAVTFDDGYADNLHSALPALEMHKVPATVFVTTAGVGAPGEFWWDALARAVFAPHALPATVELIAGDARFVQALGPEVRSALPDTSGDQSTSPRRPLYAALSAWLRALPSAHQSAAVAELIAWSGVDAEAPEAHRRLRVDELQALARSPFIAIGGHSVTHPVLGRRPADEQHLECAESRAALAQWLGAPPRHFAYPFGEGRDVGPGAERAVRAAGYDAAFTTDARAAWRWDRATSVPRFAIQAWSADEFARRLDGWFEE